MTVGLPQEAATAAGPVPAPPPAGGEPGPAHRPARGPRAERVVLWTIVLVIFAGYAGYAWARHAKYETTGFDLGIFDQVVRAYAHFDAPTSPLKGVGYNILGDHFHPILVVLVPLYWIWDDPRVLLTAQAALLAGSVVPVAAFVRRRFGAVATLLVAFGYGASWPLQQAVHFDFHEIAFAVPLIALLVDALDRRAHRTVVACCLALLLVREDMGALVLLVGLLMVARALLAAGAPGRWGPGRWGRGGRASRREPRPEGAAARRRELVLGGALALVGVGGYWAATSVVIPALAPGGFAYWTFPALGPDPASAVRTVLFHPVQVARLMVEPAVKLHTLITIFYPTGFLALLSPYVIFTVPFLAARMLNERRFLWETHFHYTSVIAPIVVMAAVDTAGRLLRRLPRALGTRRLGPLRVGLVPAFAAWTAGVVVWMLCVGGSDYPVNGLWSGRVWARSERWHAVDDVLKLIPAGQCVEADNQIAPQLTSRNYVTRITSASTAPVQVKGSEGMATWIVLDLSANRADTGWQGDRPPVALAAAQARGYRVVWHSGPLDAASLRAARPRDAGPVVLLHKDQPIAPVCRGLY